MMLKEKSSPWARMKYFYVLPLTAVAVTAFARPEISKTVEEISAVKVNELATIVETTLKESVQVPIDTTKNIVVIGERIAVGDSAIRVVGYKSEDGDIVPGKKEPLIIINGKESDIRVLNALDPACIEDISVLESADELKIYGEKGKNGVMLVRLLPKNKTIQGGAPNLTENVKARISPLLGKKNLKDLGVDVKDSYELTLESQPLVFIDGKQASGDEPLSLLSPEHIKSISVMKDKAALEVYGEKGKNGVILVRLMTDEERQYRKDNPQKPYYDALEMAMSRRNEFPNAKKLNFFIDNKEITSDEAAKVLARDIRSMKVLEDKEKSSVNIYITSEKNREK